jgi:plasmid maintenance system antidote protein VapI
MMLTCACPGEVIIEYMDARNWGSADLAEAMDLPVAHVDALLAGSRRLTVEDALILGRIFGRPASLFLSLEAQYARSLANAWACASDLNGSTPDVATRWLARNGPGNFILEELETRQWATAELARRMDVPFSSVLSLLDGCRRLDVADAVGLARAFDMSIGFFVELESQYALLLTEIANEAWARGAWDEAEAAYRILRDSGRVAPSLALRDFGTA